MLLLKRHYSYCNSTINDMLRFRVKHMHACTCLLGLWENHSRSMSINRVQMSVHHRPASFAESIFFWPSKTIHILPHCCNQPVWRKVTVILIITCTSNVESCCCNVWTNISKDNLSSLFRKTGLKLGTLVWYRLCSPQPPPGLSLDFFLVLWTSVWCCQIGKGRKVSVHV